MCCLLYTTETTCSTCGNKTHLSTRGPFSSNRRRLTNMLVVTTTKGMLYRILGHTTNLWPAIALDGVLVVGPSGLEQWLVGTASAGDNTNLCPYRGGDRLFAATGQAQTSCALVFIVCHHHRKGSTATSKLAAVSQFGFHVANNRAFGNHRQGQDVAHGQGCFLAAVNELASVHAFGANEQFIVSFVIVGIAELDLGDGCTATGVVKDFLHHTANVPMLLGVVKGTELDRSLAGANVRLEDRGFTLTLGLFE